MTFLITPDETNTLLHQGAINSQRRQQGAICEDFRPIVKIINPYGGQTWLLSEIDPSNHDLAFGLVDLGFGEITIGSVSVSELSHVTVPMPAMQAGVGTKIQLPRIQRLERDNFFNAHHTLSEYLTLALEKGRITA